MERLDTRFEAEECYGTRLILRTRCHHRRPCPSAVDERGARVHLDGLEFTDEHAAQTFDRRRLARGGKSWRTFQSWGEARAWLREGT